MNEQSNKAARFAFEYVRRLGQLLESLDYETLGEILDLILGTANSSKTVFICGNGGSAATASHMANDLQVGCFARTGKKIRAVSLTDNVAVITAAANDFGYESIFTRQLEVLGKNDDVLLCISASGNSPNCVNAIKLAKNMGMTVIGIVGFDGGVVSKIADLSLVVESAKGEYGPVEDVHMIVDHILMTYICQHN